MALKDYMYSDAKKVLMDVGEFAQTATYIRDDDFEEEVIVREDRLQFNLNNPTKIAGEFEKVVADKSRFFFMASFQPLVGDYLLVNDVQWKIIAPIEREVGLWIINAVKSARKNGIRKF